VTVFIVGDIYGLVRSLTEATNQQFFMPLWAWLLILVLILVITPFIAFHKLRVECDELKTKLNERNRNREIANQLSKFADNIEGLRNEEAAGLLTVEEYIERVLPVEESIKKYLAGNCGFSFVSRYNALPNINYGGIPILTILNSRLHNLREIIEYYQRG
jgi:hypothetical protein